VNGAPTKSSFVAHVTSGLPASKPLWCYLIPAGWLPDSGQKAKTTETRTPDLEASAAQSGLSFLGCLAQVHGWRGILERRSLSGQLPSGRGTSL